MAVGNQKQKAAVPSVDNAAILDNPDAGVGLVPLVFEQAALPLSATTLIAKTRVPFDFELVCVTGWARTVNGATIQVQVNEANVLTAALAPTTTTAAPAVGALPAARTSRRGTAGQSIGIVGISGGTSPVDLSVTVWVRPFPMNGEGTQSTT